MAAFTGPVYGFPPQCPKNKKEASIKKMTITMAYDFGHGNVGIKNLPNVNCTIEQTCSGCAHNFYFGGGLRCKTTGSPAPGGSTTVTIADGNSAQCTTTPIPPTYPTPSPMPTP